MLGLAQAILAPLYWGLNLNSPTQSHILWHFLGFCLCYWVAYLGIRLIGVRGSRLLLPVVCLINGIGLVEIFRLDPFLGHRQTYWIAAGLMAYLAISLLLRDYWILWRARWVCLMAAIGLQFGLIFWGVERNGAKLWYSLGRFNVQPVEVVKLLILVFLAGCLHQLVTNSGRKEGQVRVARRQLFIFFLCWAVCELTLAAQRDLGMALLIFGVFLALFYEATGRSRWVGAIAVTALVGAGLGYLKFSHVQIRVLAWWDPWKYADGAAYQLTQGFFSMAEGGWTGKGLGLGQPWLVPEVATDFIFCAITEELGALTGLAVIAGQLLLFLVLTQASRGPQQPFARLLLLGVAVLGIWQTTIVLFGILQLAPMTGLTLPFVSYGGSSIVANFLALGIAQRLTQPDLFVAVAQTRSARLTDEQRQAERRLRLLRVALSFLMLAASMQLIRLQTSGRPFLLEHPMNSRHQGTSR